MGGVQLTVRASVFSARQPLSVPQRQLTVSRKVSDARFRVSVRGCPSCTASAASVLARGMAGSSAAAVRLRYSTYLWLVV